jgi:hypothetical protein
LLLDVTVLSKLLRLHSAEWKKNSELKIGNDVKVTVAYFKVLSYHLPGGTEENNEKAHSGTS